MSRRISSPCAGDELLAGGDVGGGVDAPATAVAQDRHLVGDVDTQRAQPLHRVGKPGDERVAQRGVAVGVDVGEHLVRRRRPEIPGVAGRPAELAGPLDDHDGRAVAAGVGCGGEAGHAATDDGKIELLARCWARGQSIPRGAGVIGVVRVLSAGLRGDAAGGEPAVDDDLGAVDERAVVGGQPAHGGGDVVGPAEPSDGNLGEVAVPVEVLELVAHRHLRDHGTGAHGVDAHTEGPELDRRDLGEPTEGELAGRVGGQAMAADEPADRGDVDDRTGAAAGALVQPEERLDAVQRADDVDVEGVTELLDRHLRQGGGPEDAGVVDQHVEPTVAATHDVGDAGPRTRVGDVELDLMRRAGHLLGEGDVAGDHRGPAAHTSLGDGRAESPAGAGDEDDLAV